jgi:hypothetical protein
MTVLAEDQRLALATLGNEGRTVSINFVDRIMMHVPETLNNGVVISDEAFAMYEKDLLGIAREAKASAGTGEEGFNVTTNTVSNWRSPFGTIIREPVRLYWFDVADESVIHGRLLRLADRIQTELGQEAVYLTVSRVVAIVVKRSRSAN